MHWAVKINGKRIWTGSDPDEASRLARLRWGQSERTVTAQIMTVGPPGQETLVEEWLPEAARK